MSGTERRFHRQFETLSRQVPVLRGPLVVLRRKGWWIVRLPLAMLFIAGGLLSFLPVLGIWMLPFGMLLLAIDLPHLRGPISGLMVRTRRRIRQWAARWRARNR